LAASPLISCIVPVFNGELYLKETLASIVAQTYRPLEIIVIDDGSTDLTGQQVHSYGDQILYVYQHNAGPAAARNHGLHVAKGEFIAFLDADDVWVPHKLALQMARFNEYSELEMSITHIQNFWSPDLDSSQAPDPARFTEAWPAKNNTNSLLTRRHVFDTVGLFDVNRRIVEDVDWFIRAAQHGIIKELLPDITVYRRLHNGNISRRFAAQTKTEMLDIVHKLIISRRMGNG
jgi:glycosyltransferase involved in cell wall biosynthesis